MRKHASQLRESVVGCEVGQEGILNVKGGQLAFLPHAREEAL
jgi:hypothetical protein